ncbi:MAG TPA: prenyltransferase/squalene oxidase repeat-containing protein [Methanolinea sp.]|nr:prenyltransferase/squalene oxidase repeat-containing protein [Methanolinea sp.]HQK56866.1 prenyltransferase/squalene oxidase repeat-containing protein [Methanolinea sp.]
MAILGFQVESGGFGSPNATLQDTWRAVEALAMLRSQKKDQEVLSFLRSCEDPEYGYIGRLGSRPAYLEDVYAGVRLSALMGTAPRYAGACREFIERCAHQSGGFVRSVFGGAPTLEYTALAVEALAILGGRPPLPAAPIGFIQGKVQPE